MSGKAGNARAAKPLTGSLRAVAIPRSETRVTNQRLEDRHRDIVEQTIVHHRRRRLHVPVINVSSRGAMIDAEIDVKIGETLSLQFAAKHRTQCVVRWVRDGRIGVEFADETIVWDTFLASAQECAKEEAEAEARDVSTARPPRHALMRMGSLFWNGMTLPVRLRNISVAGAQVDSGKDFAPGSEVELNLGSAGFIYAEVRWSKDGQVGLRFAEEFNLDALVPATAPSVASPTEHVKPTYLESDGNPNSPWAARFERLTLTDLKEPGRR